MDDGYKLNDIDGTSISRELSPLGWIDCFVELVAFVGIVDGRLDECSSFLLDGQYDGVNEGDFSSS